MSETLTDVRIRLLKCQISKALDVARRYGQIEGDHHRAWVIDQMVRYLTGIDYAKFVSDYECEDGEQGVYEWDTGVAP